MTSKGNEAEWEVVSVEDLAGEGDERLVGTERLPVVGGWLYRTMIADKEGKTPAAVSMCFVHDPARMAEAIGELMANPPPFIRSIVETAMRRGRGWGES